MWWWWWWWRRQGKRWWCYSGDAHHQAALGVVHPIKKKVFPHECTKRATPRFSRTVVTELFEERQRPMTALQVLQEELDGFRQWVGLQFLSPEELNGGNQLRVLLRNGHNAEWWSWRYLSVWSTACMSGWVWRWWEVVCGDGDNGERWG